VSLLDKLHGTRDRLHHFGPGSVPFDTCIEQVLGPTEVVIEGRRTLMCGSNNYFGLSFHPNVIAAAASTPGIDGVATTGSRAANGTYAVHRRLEQRFADLYGVRQAKIFTTGYQANLAVITGFCGAEDSVLLDLESHASIYDGARLSGAQVFTFRHNAPDDLRRKLARLPDPSRCLVVVEGLYSVSGDLAPVALFVDACREVGALLMVDEAHSFGAFGPRGLGQAEEQGVADRVDFIVGTFSKTLAGVGGFCVSNHDELALLHFTSRPYVFTASASPASVAAVEAALDVLESDPRLRDRLWANLRHARSGFTRAGFEISTTESPIVAIRVGSAELAVAFWRQLLEHAVYVNLMLPPATHPDACLLRTSFSAAHTPEQIDRAIEAFVEVGRTLAVIPTPA